ncbi:selenoprotein O and cysteine-containing homologs [Vibrio ponticus]|nr:selenoprotein O and cysteine-containing homologs [Vibrio ponticus]
MMKSHVDYTIFFRELSNIPEKVTDISASFYAPLTPELEQEWNIWLKTWHRSFNASLSREKLSRKMKQVNPKYTWREWLIVPAYEQAEQGDFTLIHELQAVLANPYQEQSQQVDDKYYQLRPLEYFAKGGVSHYSCSS